MKTVKQAAILCGGLGTRLHPITLEIPKPLVRVGNRPMLELVLSKLVRSGISEAVLLTGYRSGQVEDYFGDGSKFNLKLIYSEEGKPLGSAGAIVQARELLEENFLVCNCDTISNYDLRRLFHHHLTRKALATLLLAQVEQIERFGIVELSDHERVSRFLEKPRPDQTKSRLANLGIYALNKEALSYATKDSFSMERELFPPYCRDGKLFGETLSKKDEWLDVGTIQELHTVNTEISQGKHAWLF